MRSSTRKFVIHRSKAENAKFFKNQPLVEVTSTIQGRSLWQDARRRFFRNKAAVASLIILCCIILLLPLPQC